MKLSSENVATLARSECQFIRTNSGDAVYTFTQEGLLRFAAKVAQPDTPANVGFKISQIAHHHGPALPQPQMGLQGWIDKAYSLEKQLGVSIADNKRYNSRLVDTLAELNGVKDANTVLRSERDTAVDNLGNCQANLVTLSRKVEEYEKLVKKVYETFGVFVL